MSITAIPSSTFSQPQLSASSGVYQQDFAQLGKDLKSGNVAAAQQDYATLQQHLRNPADPAPIRFRHHHHLGSGALGLSGGQNLSQLLTQLGQDLASGNLSAAQQAYSSLQAQPPQSTVGTQHEIEPPVQAAPVSVSA